MTNRTALARARRGAAFLDAKLGRGWRRKIARTRINMEHGVYHRGQRDCGCILAQLAPNEHYEGGAELIGIHPWETAAVRLGFYLDEDDESLTYDDLTNAWKKVLSA